MKNSRRAYQRGIWSLLPLLAIQLFGCVGYQLGSLLPEDIQSVYVPTFENKTNEPFIEADATRAVIEQIQLDGSLKIAAAQSADAVLEVTLYDFELIPLAFEKERRTLANEYRVELTAKILLKNRKTKEVIVQKSGVKGETTFILASDLTTAKRDAIPLAADDLGHDIVEKIVEVW